MTHNAQSDSDFLRELATRKHFEYVASLESERDSLRAILSELVSRPLSGIGRLPFTGNPMCDYCQMEAECLDNPTGDFPHSPDCPIVRARRLLEETNPNGE